MPSEKQVFTRASILFRPQRKLLNPFARNTCSERLLEIGGGAGYRPRVRIAYCTGRLSP